jgi:hypothetical protein
VIGEIYVCIDIYTCTHISIPIYVYIYVYIQDHSIPDIINEEKQSEHQDTNKGTLGAIVTLEGTAFKSDTMKNEVSWKE